MAIVRDKYAVRSFYEEAIRYGMPNDEGLTEPITDAFRRVLDSIPSDTPRKALDLGYGYGNYSLALAQQGFDVIAVDQIPASIFRDRLKRSGEISGAIEIVEQDIEHFVPTEQYGVLVAKDVLHFLGPCHVERMLRLAVSMAARHSYHYLAVFTDIQRTSADGIEIRLDAEAQYTSHSFTTLIEHIYQGWELEWKWVAHQERERAAGASGFYFRANRATLIAQRL